MPLGSVAAGLGAEGGRPLFGEEQLRWPGFAEFDASVGLALTFCSRSRCGRQALVSAFICR